MSVLFSEDPTAPGLFVTVDGPNGSGKSSLIAAVAEVLRNQMAVHCTRQPSPTDLGALIRAGEQQYRGRALACLIAADRLAQLQSEILPSLSGGNTVLCDRYIESSLVLQRMDGLCAQEILSLNAGIARPDIRIRLLADPEVLAQRLAARPADASRRFQRMPGSSERELQLYEQADRLLAAGHGAPATVYDTSMTDAGGLAIRVCELIGVYRARHR